MTPPTIQKTTLRRIFLNEKELADLLKLNRLVTQNERLSAELSLAKSKLLELGDTFRGLQETIDLMLPSQIVALAPEFLDALEKLKTAEAQLSALRQAESVLTLRRAKERNDLTAIYERFRQLLHYRIIDRFAPPSSEAERCVTSFGMVSHACARALVEVDESLQSNGGVVNDAKVLLQLYHEHGADLPVESRSMDAAKLEGSACNNQGQSYTPPANSVPSSISRAANLLRAVQSPD